MVNIVKRAFNATKQAVDKASRYLESTDAQDQTNNGMHHYIMYIRRGEAADLDEAIRAAQLSVQLTSRQSNSWRAVRQGYLARYLGTRYDATGTLSDLDQAITATKEAIYVIPEADIPARVERLTQLGSFLLRRYGKLGGVTDIDEAIRSLQEAINVEPGGNDTNLLRRLHLLGAALGKRYYRKRVISDCDDAIRLLQEALLQTTPGSQHERSTILAEIGVWLTARYNRLGRSADLDEAIRLKREAVASIPADKDKGAMLHNLGASLRDRYFRTSAIADLQDAILLCREALTCTSHDHPARARRLFSLSTYIHARYSRLERIVDLDDAIQLAEEAVGIAPRAEYLRMLEWYLKRRNEVQSTTDIRKEDYPPEEVIKDRIESATKDLEETPNDHPRRASRLIELAIWWTDHYLSRDEPSGSDNAIIHYQSASIQSNAPVRDRLDAGKQVVWLGALKLVWEAAFEASTITIDLIPTLALRSFTSIDKQHILTKIHGLSSDAVAVALNARKGPLVALDLLENGRSVLAHSIEDLRTDLADLQESHPGLADQFARLRDSLLQAADHGTSAWSDMGGPDRYKQVGRRSDSGHEMEKVIEQVRGLAGFEDFLRAPTSVQRRAAAERGPIVIINVSKYRCDAIILTQNNVKTKALPHLNMYDLERRIETNHIARRVDLEWLWGKVAEPVLEELGFLHPSVNEDMPHVWWIPTGPLSKFPLHAAGIHRDGSTQSVLDRVMSSYSVSVRSIVHSRRRVRPEPSALSEALLIGMRHTPKCSELYFAEKEVDQLDDICKKMGLEPIRPGRRKRDVLSHLQHCRIFHFAGHGHTDRDPLKSYLFLNDWEEDPLTVAVLQEMKLRRHPPFLAYLSACSTGQIRDQQFLDESSHLIGACQLIGFRHVIGTLWEVNDESCVEVARLTYEEMSNGDMTDDSVCRGLHKATKELRSQWLSTASAIRKERQDGTLQRKRQNTVMAEAEVRNRDDRDEGRDRDPRDVLSCSDSDEEEESTPGLHWVPYVHYGV